MSTHPLFLDPTDQSVARLLQRGISGPITMLNLLRFPDWADYSDFPETAPPYPISGSEAYDRYMDHTMTFLTATGGSVSFLGLGGHNLVGPPRKSDGTSSWP